MSIQVIARVLPKRWGSPSRKIVALKLADVAREDGTKIYPSIATVAAEAELSERQVQRVMNEFRTEGLLVVTRKGGGRLKTTEYRFDMVAIESLPDARPMPEGEVVSFVRKGDAMSPIADQVLGAMVLKGDTQSQKGDTVSPNPSLPLSTSSKRDSASNEAGADTPSVSKEVWKEGIDLLKTTSLNPNRSIIGKWLKRTETKKDGKEKLLAMIRAAVAAGTLDPIAYITKAIDNEFGPLPQPKQFDAVTWERNIQAAIKTRDWSLAWGPPPGRKGCLVPPQLISVQLTSALAGRKAAA